MNENRIIEKMQNNIRRFQIFNAVKAENPDAPLQDILAESARRAEEQNPASLEIPVPTEEERAEFRETLKKIRINNG